MKNKTKAVFLILLFFFTSCNNDPKGKVFCEKPEHWAYNEIDFLDNYEIFTEITVKDSSYIIWGYEIQNDKEFVNNIRGWHRRFILLSVF